MKLKPAFRRFLKRPLGRLLSSRDAVTLFQSTREDLTATVGDVTTLLFLSHFVPSISIVDFQVQRKPIEVRLAKKLRALKSVSFKCKNPAGTISTGAQKAVKAAVSAAVSGRPAVIFVDGEEDLLLLPLLLAVPEGSLLFYGQPNKGVVAVRATKAKKKRVRELFKKCFE
jgi:uncharacterized protein (UPF0218 family)